MDTFFHSASISEAFASAGGSVTGRNVWVAVSGHEQTGVCGGNQQPAVGLPHPGQGCEPPCSHALVEAKKLVKSVFVTSVPCPRSRSCLGN